MRTVPIHEAAEYLGISVVAVRKRAQRGSLAGEKRDGVWYIEIEDGPPTGPPTGSPQVDSAHEDETLALLRVTVEMLREQLNAKDQQIADLMRQGERLQSLLGNEQETTQRLLASGPYAAPSPTPERTAPTDAPESPAPAPHAAPDAVQRVQPATARGLRSLVARLLGLA